VRPIKPRICGFIEIASLAMAALLSSGCSVSHTTQVRPSGPPVVLQTATKDELIVRYNRRAEAISSVNAAVEMQLTAGSAYAGLIEQYHQVNGFIMGERPSSIRVIGQAPVVGKDIFDMVSDGQTFRIFVPSKGKFIVGPAKLERAAGKPIERLRPQHLMDALFWPAIPTGVPVLLEEATEANSHYYVLTVVRPDKSRADTNATGLLAPDWETAQKIWFDRVDLNVARIETYETGGKVSSDIRCRRWAASGALGFPREIVLSRPSDDYELRIGINRLTLNEPIATGRFVLEQPPGTELVRVEAEGKESKP
jgi:outer membrane lipoprotein-sorting protein